MFIKFKFEKLKCQITIPILDWNNHQMKIYKKMWTIYDLVGMDLSDGSWYDSHEHGEPELKNNNTKWYVNLVNI